MDDFELFACWRRGDRVAADEIVLRHDGPLRKFFRYKMSADEVDDLTQQVWLELAKSGPIVFRSSFRAYLYGIARNVLCRHLERKLRVPAWDPLTTSLEDLQPSPSQEVAQSLSADDLRMRLRRLPLDLHLLLELRYMQDLSTNELATIYDVPLGTIKRRLWHARRQLEAALPPDARSILHR